MKMRAQRLPEVPGKPLRHPWGTLGALQGAVGAVMVPPGELLGAPGGPSGSSWDVPGTPWGPFLEPFLGFCETSCGSVV